MNVAIRRYTGDANRVSELKSQIEANFVPELMKIPGFSAYYVVDCGGGNVSTISVFETEAGERESTRIAVEFVKQYVGQTFTRTAVDEGSAIIERHAPIPA
jgi:hypothetical protein